jgi:putative colanic acid biosynthesis acetyltransferase WcaF
LKMKRAVRLATFESTLERGVPVVVEAAWLFASLLVSSNVPGSAWRRSLLRLFGAKIGRGVVIKPRVRVKFPWRLAIDFDSWIGEAVWIDNLAWVRIGANCCISQGSYLCTGSHDWSASSFDLITSEIIVEDESWVAAKCVIGPGVVIARGAVIGIGSVLTKSCEPWCVYAGNPAQQRRSREVSKG